MAASRETMIQLIKDSECFEHKGTLHVTESIGAGAKVVVTDGSLIVDGSIHDGAHIELRETPRSYRSGTQIGGLTLGYVSIRCITGGGEPRTLSVQGNVGENVTITSLCADYSIAGEIGRSCYLKTENGNIKVTKVGESSSLISSNGNITCHDVGKHTCLKTSNGTIRAEAVAEQAEVSTNNGDVRVASSQATTKLHTDNGNVYINGTIQPKPMSAYGRSSYMTGGSTFFSSRSIIIDGVDMTPFMGSSFSRR
ncbi:hypothetical protein ELY21_05985 [Legionella sp. km535]|uniref:DUF4097 family beta strand repeat-containing protein n=1 Tax=Legionella sp. km535 TaxID=2498107 RepID=UPI000F8F5951|nr:DUF4097 family beta strand repeat-containing protein [Legionella sp. km535]RUR19073.1 hypothetical protein ELY21_05985 [Legionella sp. km535]